MTGTELTRTLPASVFWPRPKVVSAVIHIEVDRQRRGAIEDLGFFHDFSRALFFHRRKYLRSVLASALKGRVEKPAIEQIIAASGLNPECRAEQLDVAAILNLTGIVRSSLAAQSQ